MDRRSFLATALAPLLPTAFASDWVAEYRPKRASDCYRHLTFDFNWVGGDIQDYFKRADPVAYAEFCKAITLDAAVLMAVSHHGYCSYGSTIGPRWPAMQGDWFGRQIEELHKRGIAAIGYISLARNWKYAEEHPEHAWQRSAKEKFICLNSPYLDLVVAYTEEVLRNYPVDALRYDTLEQAPYHDCEGCRKFYRQLYREELPAAWTPENWRRLLDFYRATTSRAVERLRDVAKSIKPSIETWHNGFIAAGRMDDNNIEAGRLQDIAYVEVGDPFRQLFLAGVMRLRGIIVGRILESPVRRLCMALGARCYSYYRVNRETLLPDDRTWFLDDLAPFYRMVSRVQPYIEGAKPVSYFGIVYCEATRYRYYRYDREGYIQILRGITEHYLNRSLPIEFLSNLDLTSIDLSQFRLLLLPETSGLTPAEVDALKNYARSGGTLLLTGEALRYDEAGAPLADFALASEMGIHFLRRPPDHLPLEFTPEWTGRTSSEPARQGVYPSVAVPALRRQVLTSVEATQGRTLIYADSGGKSWPVAHVRDYGKGRIAYLAISDAMDLLAPLIDKLIASVPVVVEAKHQAVLTHQAAQQRWILHLLSDEDMALEINRDWAPVEKVVGRYPNSGFDYRPETSRTGLKLTVKGTARDRLLVLRSG